MVMEGKENFFPDYFLVKPKKASLIDIGRFLFSSNLKNRDFIETSFEKESSFHRRLLVAVTVLLQKFVLVMPLETIRKMLEYPLNFLHLNGGFIRLLTNIILGKVEYPDWNAPTCLSLIGLMDMRMELDSHLKYGKFNYYPALCIMACKAVYNNPAYNRALIQDQWKMEFLGFFNYWNDSLRNNDTYAMMFRDKSVDHDTVFVCFRGTEPFCADDWCTDFDVSNFELPGIGFIHHGFAKALGMHDYLPKPISPFHNSVVLDKKLLAYYDIRDRLKDILEKSPNAKFVVTGHSLGGALAAIFPTLLFHEKEHFLIERMEAVYTFGQPRVGDEHFANYMDKNLKTNGIHHYRYVYSYDMIPRVPFDDILKHFGTCVYYNSNYEAKIVDEVPYRNYFSIRGFVAMRINAMYELIRSFIMWSKYGANYREGWLVFGMRMFGLVIPGLSAHCSQDYVNATRLGSPSLKRRFLTGAIRGIWIFFCISKISMNMVVDLTVSPLLKLFK